MMRRWLSFFALVPLVLALTAAPAFAGGDDAPAGSTAAAQTPDEGVLTGGYRIRQVIELGGQFADFDGNARAWNTFVNLDDGPRLMEYSLSMRGEPGTGLLFDDLSMSNYGYGGNPNNVSRLRMWKAKWYDFRSIFRRDRNSWDFNLLANPYNPAPADPTTFPSNTSIEFSTHRMYLVRKMGDFDLTLLPQSKIKFRLGFGHNSMNGQSFITYHEGADPMLNQPWRTTSYRTRFGVDFDLLPKTRFSYDQYFDWFKQDTSANLGYYAFGQLNDGSLNGAPLVELGITLDGSQPCAAPIVNNTVDPPAIDPACSGYLSYNRTNPYRGRYPTEKFSFQSSYFDRVDLGGSLIYNHSKYEGTFDEAFFGRVSRTFHQRYSVHGPVENKRIAASGDFSATVHITDWMRVAESFTWHDFRSPAVFDMSEASEFSNRMDVPATVYNPATCSPTDETACPLYAGRPNNSSSPADLISERFVQYFGQDVKTNLLELQLEPVRRLGVSLGWRFRDREITLRHTLFSDLTYFPGKYALSLATPPTATRGQCSVGNEHGAVPDPVTGVCRVVFEEGEVEPFAIREHALVLGLWARPVDGLRVSFDTDWMSADNIFTRITPRRVRQHKLRVNASPRPWINLSGTVNVSDWDNDTAEILFAADNRAYGFNASFLQGDRWSLDTSYNYSSYRSDTNFCYTWTARAGETFTNPSTSVNDPVFCDTTSTSAFYDFSVYENNVHFGSLNFMFKPHRRVTAMGGYSVTSSAAEALDLNSLGPAGVLGVNYHLPTFLVQVQLADRWAVKTGYNHYGYNEKFDSKSVEPRDFRGNVLTLGVRYSF